MNVTILSNDMKLKHTIESYTHDIFIHQMNDISSFFQEIIFLKPHLLILDCTEKEIYTIYQKIKEDENLEQFKILFLVDRFNLSFFQKLGYNIGEIDYIQKPVEINQFISRINSYNTLLKIRHRFSNIEDYMVQYSQSVIKGEMLGIISHQWKQPLNIIATAIINIELKSELERLEHCDIKNCVDKVHDTLEKITNMIHSYEDIFKSSLVKSDFSINEAFLKSVNLMSPQLKSHKIKILNNITKKNYLTTNFENELCQSILCLLSIIQDSIIKKYNQDPTFNGSIKLQIDKVADKVSLKIINKRIESSTQPFNDSLYLNNLYDSSLTHDNSKLYISKEIIENKLNGNLNISKESKDIIFSITI